MLLNFSIEREKKVLRTEIKCGGRDTGETRPSALRRVLAARKVAAPVSPSVFSAFKILNKNRGVHKMWLTRRHFLFIFFRRMDGQTDRPTFRCYL